MITLDEQGKYQWTIKYTILEGDQIIPLVEGKLYDFIPEKDDFIKIDGKHYRVCMRVQDFDSETLWISLISIENQ